ncbi:MAG TPA: GNAT family N-acetyltransferase [Thermoplasmata archaeon]|nr:GNAT family N-acetyltransferase [Thermoplasmata archaeon]
MLRDLRRGDTERVFTFLTREFPEEEALLGTRPEGFERIVSRAFRWDTRLLLALARLLGRSPFRFLVFEADGQIVGTTMVSFTPRAGYLAMVVVDPAYRGRGLARRLLEEARAITARRGRPYVVLDVLDSNSRAVHLYDSAGYRRLRGTGLYVHDRPVSLLPFVPPPQVRPFAAADAGVLLGVSQRTVPAAVQEVLPASPSSFRPSPRLNHAMATEVAAWVIDRGHGAEGYVSGAITAATEAGHLSEPLLSDTVPPDLGAALTRTAAAWCAGRKAPRLVSVAANEPPQARAALEAAGFHHAISVSTLYRPVG